jgi:hypothetical protein
MLRCPGVEQGWKPAPIAHFHILTGGVEYCRAVRGGWALSMLGGLLGDFLLRPLEDSRVAYARNFSPHFGHSIRSKSRRFTKSGVMANPYFGQVEVPPFEVPVSM